MLVQIDSLKMDKGVLGSPEMYKDPQSLRLCLISKHQANFTKKSSSSYSLVIDFRTIVINRDHQ